MDDEVVRWFAARTFHGWTWTAADLAGAVAVRRREHRCDRGAARPERAGDGRGDRRDPGARPRARHPAGGRGRGDGLGLDRPDRGRGDRGGRPRGARRQRGARPRGRAREGRRALEVAVRHRGRAARVPRRRSPGLHEQLRRRPAGAAGPPPRDLLREGDVRPPRGDDSRRGAGRRRPRHRAPGPTAAERLVAAAQRLRAAPLGRVRRPAGGPRAGAVRGGVRRRGRVAHRPVGARRPRRVGAGGPRAPRPPSPTRPVARSHERRAAAGDGAAAAPGGTSPAGGARPVRPGAGWRLRGRALVAPHDRAATRGRGPPGGGRADAVPGRCGGPRSCPGRRRRHIGSTAPDRRSRARPRRGRPHRRPGGRSARSS